MYKGFCHRTESDLFLFLFGTKKKKQEPQGALIAHLSTMSTKLLFKVRFLSK